MLRATEPPRHGPVQSIFTEGAKYIAGHNPMEIKRIDKAVIAMTQELANLSKPTNDHKEIAQVGTISANGDNTIGEIIAEAGKSR